MWGDSMEGQVDLVRRRPYNSMYPHHELLLGSIAAGLWCGGRISTAAKARSGVIVLAVVVDSFC